MYFIGIEVGLVDNDVHETLMMTAGDEVMVI